MSFPVRRELEQYVAGRAAPEQVVIAAAVAYYGDGRSGVREALQPLIRVIDRASPGIVELGSVAGGSGFEVRLAERPFPKGYEAELHDAAVAALDRLSAAEAARLETASGLMRRMLAAIQRWFSA